ncbi:S8 family serine peptidase [Alkalihalobacillus sp. LMS39]|uniref:S8 family serine peptidase n=1 Tax=Alkalihalobacillus sp. LMS39 TaxID=2924032 RepID=UPI001FB3CD0A|nr:S8 family serine peptidase [Alkalihalobacillus sp. LMS39]UOE93949.1 S8 family serine peptidase [Alkalihalobacillus sp. LMS39]
MRQVLLLFTMLFAMTQVGLVQVQANQFPERPPLPTPASEQEAVVIVEVSETDIDAVLETIKSTFPKGEIRKTFQTLFTGFSIQLPEKDVERLKTVSGIERVDKVVNYKALIDESVPFIGGGEFRSQLDENGERLTGKGVKVAVIDTGIDYTHPDLKRNYKGGFDVVDYDDDPMETKIEEGGPTVHGTHVAGIIAANGKIKGVAPEADIYAYRALGPGGQGTTEQVIEAIEKAVEDGVDIINLSLGNAVNGPDWPTSVALDKAVELGVVAVTSNGNSGPNMWTVGSPGTSARAISVGASSPPLKMPYLTIFGEEKEIPLQMMSGSRPWDVTRDFPFVYGELGMEKDLEDVNGKIVLLKRGILPFAEKARIAKEAGAEAVVIFNNTDGAFVGAIEGKVDIPVAGITKEDGEWLLEQIENEKSPSLRTIYRNEEDLIAPFSSRGPVTQTWDVKPDVVAPGVAIDSTIPHGYLGLNGTSMSAPHVAGAAALLKQAHPDWTPDQIKAALMNTAKKLEDKEGNRYLPHEQGAGRIQIVEAINAETLVLPGALSFGKYSRDDRRQVKDVTVTVENKGDKTETYYVVPPIDVPDGIQWKVPFSFDLKPDEKKEVTITMDIFPPVLEEGIHNGEVVIQGGKEDVVVPYLFFIEEPNYPRVMAFNFEHGDEPETYRYEMYLPGGAEEVGIALYDPDTFEFISYLDARENVARGLLEVELSELGLTEGIYKALVFAKQDGQEDTLETAIFIGEIG